MAKRLELERQKAKEKLMGRPKVKMTEKMTEKQFQKEKPIVNLMAK